AYEVELDSLRRIHPRPQRLDQQLVGHFHDRADNGGRQFAVDGFADHRAVDLRGCQRVNTEAGDHQKHMRRVDRFTQLAYFATQVRVNDVEKNHAAHKVRYTHRVAPDTHGANQENEVLRLGVECGRGQHQGQAHQQTE